MFNIRLLLVIVISLEFIAIRCRKIIVFGQAGWYVDSTNLLIAYSRIYTVCILYFTLPRSSWLDTLGYPCRTLMHLTYSYIMHKLFWPMTKTTIHSQIDKDNLLWIHEYSHVLFALPYSIIGTYHGSIYTYQDIVSQGERQAAYRRGGSDSTPQKLCPGLICLVLVFDKIADYVMTTVRYPFILGHRQSRWWVVAQKPTLYSPANTHWNHQLPTICRRRSEKNRWKVIFNIELNFFQL